MYSTLITKLILRHRTRDRDNRLSILTKFRTRLLFIRYQWSGNMPPIIATLGQSLNSTRSAGQASHPIFLEPTADQSPAQAAPLALHHLLFISLKSCLPLAGIPSTARSWEGPLAEISEEMQNGGKDGKMWRDHFWQFERFW